jgi:hypothetical protein
VEKPKSIGVCRTEEEEEEDYDDYNYDYDYDKLLSTENYNLTQLFCTSRPSDNSMLSLKAFLHIRFTKSSLGTGNYIMTERQQFLLAETRTLILLKYNIILTD